MADSSAQTEDGNRAQIEGPRGEREPVLLSDPIPPSGQPSSKQRADVPHPVILIITICSMLAAFASLITALLNYHEARRNNLHPPALSASAFLTIEPHGVDPGEFEIAMKNDGKTPAYGLRVRNVLGIGVRPTYRGGGNPETQKAYFDATKVYSKGELGDGLPEVVREDSSWRRRPQPQDVLGPNQSAVVRVPGGFLKASYDILLAGGKAYLVIAGYIEYSPTKDESPSEKKFFCFERHPPFSPGPKQELAFCSDEMNFLF